MLLRMCLPLVRWCLAALARAGPLGVLIASCAAVVSLPVPMAGQASSIPVGRDNASGRAVMVAVEPGSYLGDGVGRVVVLDDGQEFLAIARRGNDGVGVPAYICLPRADVAGHLTEQFPLLSGLRVRHDLAAPEWRYLGACLSGRTRLAPSVVVAEWDHGTVLLVDEFSRADGGIYAGFLELPDSAVDSQRIQGVSRAITASWSGGAPVGRVVRDDGTFVVCEDLSVAEPLHWQTVTLDVLVDGRAFRSLTYRGVLGCQAFAASLIDVLIREISDSVLDAEDSLITVTVAAETDVFSWQIAYPASDFTYRGRTARRCVEIVSGTGVGRVVLTIAQEL